MTETDPAFQAHLDETVAAGARVLEVAWQRSVQLEQVESFRGPTARASVLRCRVLLDPAAARPSRAGTVPETVIVKRFRAGSGKPYDLEDTNPTGARSRFLSEWSGTAFLTARPETRHFGPACYGGDGVLGMVVLEDLGQGGCLADFLQAENAAQAEAGLAAFAATLGALNGATAGREDALAQLRARVGAGGSVPDAWQPASEWAGEALPKFRALCDTLETPLSTHQERELTQVAALIHDPGSFAAFSVSDTCPDNHRFVAPCATADAGRTGYVRFFDMEFGGFRHALLDAVYLWLPFPTCWCVNRLPAELPPRLEAIYRAALVEGCPDAADDRRFNQGLAAACVWWMVVTFAWEAERSLEKDHRWGISSVRQRFPLRGDNTATVCERTGAFPAMGTLARTLAARLRARWGPDAEMPLYPPFRPKAKECLPGAE